MQPRKPIYSTCEDDPDLREAISDFVIGLAEAVDILQDLHSDGTFEALATRCREHAGVAASLGYPAFAELAREIAAAADEEKAAPAEAGLHELGGLVQRIRQAHRGSA